MPNNSLIVYLFYILNDLYAWKLLFQNIKTKRNFHPITTENLL